MMFLAWPDRKSTENEYNKLDNSQNRIQNHDYTENKIKICEMKQILSDNSVRLLI